MQLFLSLCLLLLPLRSWASSTTFDALATIYAVPSSASTSLSAFTFCSWIYRTGSGEGSGGFIVARGTAGAEWRLWNWTGGTVYVFELTQPATTDGEWRTPAASYPALNAWHHFCLTFDGGNVANDPLMYINGVSVAVTQSLTPSAVYAPATSVMSIGNASGADRTWGGRLAHVGYWNRLLSANEIRSVFLYGCRTNARGLIGYWPLGVHGGANLTATTGIGATETLGAGTKNGDGPPVSYVPGGTLQ